MQYEGYPLIGDQTYGFRKSNNINIAEEAKNFPRQALHAEILELRHPVKKNFLEIKSNLPDDLNELEKIIDNEK